MLRADLHIHTRSSHDGSMTPEGLIAACQRRGINCVAVTDHNIIEGAFEAAGLAPFTVIIGQEIRTREGEIIGLFLSEQIPRGLSPEDSIERIRAQGGVVVVPHPFDRIRRSTILPEALTRIAPLIDAVEVFNSRIMFPHQIAQARSFARRHGLLSTAGSDSHLAVEVGHAYVEMPEFVTPSEFLSSLAKGKITGRMSSPLVHVQTTWNKWKKRTRPQ